ncbi:MAG: PQQ-dependent sugar dehydrogenase, partial [Lewinella sp.]|nr:PQQ-dependent sugar dehydrogenase [Lewinella sp.]
MHSWLSSFFLLLVPVFLTAQPTVELVEIASGLTQPVDIVSMDNGYLFVVEQPGRIRIITPDHTVLPAPFLDITDRVNNSGWERGLLGMALHPDFANNGLFFVNYTGSGGHTRVARYMVSPGDPMLADPDSEVILFTVNQPYS